MTSSVSATSSRGPLVVVADVGPDGEVGDGERREVRGRWRRADGEVGAAGERGVDADRQLLPDRRHGVVVAEPGEEGGDDVGERRARRGDRHVLEPPRGEGVAAATAASARATRSRASGRNWRPAAESSIERSAREKRPTPSSRSSWRELAREDGWVTWTSGGGGADRPGVGDGDEISQMAQLHVVIMPHGHGSRAQEVLDSMTSGEDAGSHDRHPRRAPPCLKPAAAARRLGRLRSPTRGRAAPRAAHRDPRPEERRPAGAQARGRLGRREHRPADLRRARRRRHPRRRRRQPVHRLRRRHRRRPRSATARPGSSRPCSGRSPTSPTPASW